MQPLISTSDVLAAMDLFMDHGWTDGLPIVPPTEELVREFLETVGRDPDEVILRVQETQRDVTVGLAAINSVMAGCFSACFPVVLAALEGWADDRWGLGDRTWFYISNASTGGGAPLLIVNGPIRHELKMATGVNAFGPGSRANATIGRAMRLIIINALGMASGVLDHATQGHPGKYSFCIAENEEESPWDPLHVERGFARDDSAVTVFSGRSPEPVENRASNTAEGILYSVTDTMSRVAALIGPSGPVVIALGPEHAGIIARRGWSKSDVKEYLFENAKRPIADLERSGRRFSQPRDTTSPRSNVFSSSDGVEFVHVCRSPEDVHVVVAGGNNGGVSCVITPWSYYVPVGELIVKPIEESAMT